MKFQQILRETRPRMLNTKPGVLIQFPGGGVGMVIRSIKVDRGANDYSVVILSGGSDGGLGSLRHCLHCYDYERVNIEIVEPIKYVEVTS